MVDQLQINYSLVIIIGFTQFDFDSWEHIIIITTNSHPTPKTGQIGYLRFVEVTVGVVVVGQGLDCCSAAPSPIQQPINHIPNLTPNSNSENSIVVKIMPKKFVDIIAVNH